MDSPPRPVAQITVFLFPDGNVAARAEGNVPGKFGVNGMLATAADILCAQLDAKPRLANSAPVGFDPHRLDGDRP